MITFLLIVFLLSGTLIALLAVPLILGKVGPNPLYGFRVRQTLEDPAVWYPANAYAGKCLLAMGLSIIAAAVILYLVPEIDFTAYALAVGAVTLVALAANVILSFRYLHSLSKPGDK